MTLSWSASSGASGYQLYRSSTQNGTYTLLTDVATTTFVDSAAKTALTPGVAYFYKVRAYREQGGQKAYSDYSSIENNGVIRATISFGNVAWHRESGQDVALTQSITITTSGGKGNAITITEILSSTYSPHAGETDRTSSTQMVSTIGQSFTFNRTLHLYNNGPQSSNMTTYTITCDGGSNAKGYPYCSAKFTRQGNWGTPWDPGW